MILIIETETTDQMEAVVSFLNIAVNMQRDANALIDFTDREEIEEIYGFSVDEYKAAMDSIKRAVK